MTDAELRLFLEGLIRAWSLDARVEASREAADLVARVVHQGGQELCRVRRGRRPFGVVWTVAAPDARTRTHPSAQGAIRSLGAILAPARPMARVMFAGGMGAAS